MILFSNAYVLQTFHEMSDLAHFLRHSTCLFQQLDGFEICMQVKIICIVSKKLYLKILYQNWVTVMMNLTAVYISIENN